MSARIARRHRLLAGVAMLGVGAALLAGGSAEHTQAAWNDREHGSAALQAATLVSPSVTSVSCSRDGSGSSQRLDVRWAWPAGAPVVPVAWTLNGSAITPALTVHAPNDFTSVITTGLNGGPFGQTHTVELRAVSENWLASDRRQIRFVARFLWSPSCTVTA